MNILVVTDVSWDNIPVINRRFRKISPDDTIHSVYYKGTNTLHNCCLENSLKFIRHSKDTVQDSLCEILNFCDLCLVFHNFVEYNNASRFVINKCEEYKIPCFIFSENSRDFIYFYGEIPEGASFRNVYKKIQQRKRQTVEFTDEIIESRVSKPLDLEEAKKKLSDGYKDNEDIKKIRSIKLLYDKTSLKSDKEAKKAVRQMSKLQFDNNRLTYYKTK